MISGPGLDTPESFYSFNQFLARKSHEGVPISSAIDAYSAALSDWRVSQPEVIVSCDRLSTEEKARRSMKHGVVVLRVDQHPEVFRETLAS